MEYYSGYKESDLEDLLVALNKNMLYTRNKNKNILNKYNHKLGLHIL